jgi:hypothetical protein
VIALFLRTVRDAGLGLSLPGNPDGAHANPIPGGRGINGNYMPSTRGSGRHGARPFRLARCRGQESLTMLSHAHAVAAHRRPPPSTLSQPPELSVEPLDWLGEITGDRVLLLGGDGPELMCALIRAGATEVTHLRSQERPEAGSANVVIVPRVPSLDWLAAALPSIRRALAANGRLVIRGGAHFNFLIEARRMLTLNGFVAIRPGHGDEGQTLAAETRTPRIHPAL